MERYAWKAKLKEGKKAEYQKRHDEIWPEMKELLTAVTDGFSVEPAEAQDDNPSEGEGTDEGTDEGEGEEVGPKPDSNGLILPIEYRGKTINADSNGYYYEAGENDRVYCFFFGARDEEGTLTIDFWYDSRIDHFIPLVVEVTK